MVDTLGTGFVPGEYVTPVASIGVLVFRVDPRVAAFAEQVMADVEATVADDESDEE